MLLSKGRTILLFPDDDVCPLCLAMREPNRLGPNNPLPRHPLEAGDSRGQVLMRCGALKGECVNSNGCIICVGGDHPREHCPIKSSKAFELYHACKACSLQIKGTPITHSGNHTSPDSCTVPGKNFVVEFCLALYRRCPQEMDRIFAKGQYMGDVPRYWSRRGGAPSDTDLKVFISQSIPSLGLQPPLARGSSVKGVCFDGALPQVSRESRAQPGTDSVLGAEGPRRRPCMF